MASAESARHAGEPHGVRPSSSQPLLGQALQQQAPGLRISKAAAHAGGGLPPPPSVPSNRSEAVRLQPYACSRMPAAACRRRHARSEGCNPTHPQPFRPSDHPACQVRLTQLLTDLITSRG
jgi:hypothetical protein